MKQTTPSHRARIGKIARLPDNIREELNHRLLDGEQAKPLLRWLNDLPKVQKILAAQFDGRPITKQNLSEWKLGGYRDWQRAEENRLRLDRLTEQAAQLTGADTESPLSEKLAAVLLVELAAAFEEFRDQSRSPAERWQLLRQMLREVSQVRREDHRAAKLRIEKERWESEVEEKLEEDHAQWRKETKERRSGRYDAILRLPIMAGMIAQQFDGNREMAWQFAAEMLEIEHDMEPGTLGGHRKSDPVKPSPTESEPERDSKRTSRSGRAKRRKRTSQADRADEEVDLPDEGVETSDQHKPSQTQSNPVGADQADIVEESGWPDAGASGPIEADEANSDEV